MQRNLGLFAALFYPGYALATVTAVADPPSGATCTVTSLGGGLYDVSVVRESYAGDVTVNIRGATSDSIRNVSINSGAAGRDTFFSVRGPNAGDRITSIATFLETSGSGYTEIIELRPSGNVGDGGTANDAIKVDAWSGGDIAGSITDKVELTTGDLEDVFVDDGVFGNITITAGNLTFLEVTNGPIGQVGTPVTISVKLDLTSVEATEVHANITTGVSATGYINRLVTTSGDLTGSIVTDGIRDDAGVVGEVNVADDMTASITVGGDLTAPIIIGGDATGDITVDRLYFNAGGQGTITIGDKLIGDLTVDDANGIDRQVVLNANNNVYGTWTDAWTGDVIVNGRPCFPRGPTMTRTSAMARSASPASPAISRPASRPTAQP
jgi:hypothetical protein